MIVRWGLESLEEVLAELSVSAPLLITEELWQDTELPVARRFHGARPHAEITGVREATELAQDADGLVALGGGSVMDTTKAVSVQTGPADGLHPHHLRRRGVDALLRRAQRADADQGRRLRRPRRGHRLRAEADAADARRR